MAATGSQPGAGEHAREAVAQFAQAARLGSAALRLRRAARSEKPPLSERLNPATTEKGGRIGDAADWLLARGGVVGKLASKASLGSRIVERLRPGDDDADERGDEPSGGDVGDEKPPVPIQESIDVAVPIEVAWDLAKRFEDYPEFVERVAAVEDGQNGVTFEEVGARGRATEIEIVDEYPAQRIDWEGHGGFEHSGAASFHALAPGLTRIELSLDVAPGGPIERAKRRLGLTERAIRTDLRRFKAYAELWQDVEEPVADEDAELEDSGYDEGEDEDLDADDDYEEDEELEMETTQEEKA